MSSASVLLLLALLGQPLTPAQAARETPVSRVARQTLPAVVNISATHVVERAVSMFGSRPVETNSVGSGVVIHEDGFVLTNAHVVARASELRVIFSDKREFPARVIAELPEEDLAVVQVTARARFPAVKLGRSDDLMVGESVIAIGNPVGLGHTVTTGILSALGRELSPKRGVNFKGILQTDAAINPGNSGGPLLNGLGELIGVNTAIRSDAQNVGFAIPVNKVKSLLPAMLGVEARGRVKLGLSWSLAHDGEGALIDQVRARSPAARAGLRGGMRVVDVGGRPTPSLVHALVALLQQPVGVAFSIQTRGADGVGRTHRVEIEALPKPDGAALAKRALSLSVSELDAKRARQLGLRAGSVLVVESAGGSAARAGIRRGDLLAAVAGYGVSSLEELGYILEDIPSGSRVACRVLRLAKGRVLRQSVLLRVP